MKSLVRIMSFVLMLSVLLCSFTLMSASAEDKYKDVIVPQYLDEGDIMEFGLEYGEIYEYYAPGNTPDECEPDYVLFSLDTLLSFSMPYADMFGDYVVKGLSGTHPLGSGYGIYIPAEGKAYSLSKAWEMGIEGIENVFLNTKIGSLIGDADRDRKLTVKDATYIQKCLAGLEEFYRYDEIIANRYEGPNYDGAGLPVYVTDFNCDHQRDVKDATAIQKHLAGLEV